MNEEPEITNQGKVEYSVDLDNLPSITHRWVERGDVLSCEGASHPTHRHFKVRVVEDQE